MDSVAHLASSVATSLPAPHTIWVVVHLLGTVVGMGGALASDAMFLTALKDMHVSKTEMRFLRLGGRMVWIGLAILVVSGLFLFLDDADRLLASPKFRAKMSVVAVIILNGAVLHLRLIPRIDRHVGSDLPSSDEFIRKRYEMFSSGAVSVVSWFTALVLGASRMLPLSYGTIMAIYVVLLLVAVVVANIFGRMTLPPHGRLPR